MGITDYFRWKKPSQENVATRDPAPTSMPNTSQPTEKSNFDEATEFEEMKNVYMEILERQSRHADSTVDETKTASNWFYNSFTNWFHRKDNEQSQFLSQTAKVKLEEEEEEKLSTDEVFSILSDRDETIRLGAVPELSRQKAARKSENQQAAGDDLADFYSIRLLDRVDNQVQNSTGWDRVNQVYNIDPELQNSLLGVYRDAAGKLPKIAGVFYGFTSAIQTLPVFKDSFIRENKMTVYLTPEMAKRRYFDTLALNALKFGTARGIRLFAWSYSAMMGPLLISAYRGKSGFWEHTFTWSFIFPLLFIGQGPRMAFLLGMTGFTAGLTVDQLLLRGMNYFTNGEVCFESIYRDYVKLGLVKDAQHRGEIPRQA